MSTINFEPFRQTKIYSDTNNSNNNNSNPKTIDHQNSCSICFEKLPSITFKNNLFEELCPSLNFTNKQSNIVFSHSSFLEIIKNTNKIITFDQNFQSFGQRSRILSNLKVIVQNFNYSKNTFYSAVSYVDCVLTKIDLPDEYINLFTYCCCVIAAKVIEPQSEIPLLENSVEFFKNTFSAKIIKDMENQILQLLQFNLIVQNPYSVLLSILSIGVVSFDEVNQSICSNDHVLIDLEGIIFEFIDTMSLHYLFNEFSPLLIACSAISCARKAMGLDYWSPQLHELTSLSWQDLIVVSDKLIEVILNMDSSKFYLFRDFNNFLNCCFHRKLEKNDRMEDEYSSNRTVFQDCLSNHAMDIDNEQENYNLNSISTKLKIQERQNSFFSKKNQPNGKFIGKDNLGLSINNPSFLKQTQKTPGKNNSISKNNGSVSEKTGFGSNYFKSGIIRG